MLVKHFLPVVYENKCGILDRIRQGAMNGRVGGKTKVGKQLSLDWKSPELEC